MSELIEWSKLQDEWAKTQNELSNARKQLDEMVRNHLEQRGDPPLLRKLQEIDDLIHLEANARGAIDEFIADLCH